MLYRCPLSHLVFEDKAEYVAHLNGLHWIREIPWQEERRLKNQYKQGRASLQALTTFEDIFEWLNVNKELTLRVPCLGKDALGNSKGDVAPYAMLECVSVRPMTRVSSSLVSFSFGEFDQRFEDKSGWKLKLRIGVPRGTDPRFKISDQCRGLIAYGILVKVYDFNRDDLTGETYFDLETYMLARDFKNLAMFEKLAGRLTGNMLDYQVDENTVPA